MKSFRFILLLVPCVAAALLVSSQSASGSVHRAGNVPGCSKVTRGEDIKQSGQNPPGIAAPADGAKATWYIRSGDSPHYYAGTAVNQTMWVGVNGKSTSDSWIEFGAHYGAFNLNEVDYHIFYTERVLGGINGQIDDAIISSLGDPRTMGGQKHTFTIRAYNGGYNIFFDGASYKHWPSVVPPTIEYNVGLEAKCGGGSLGDDWLNDATVTAMFSIRHSDQAWVQNTGGAFFLNGPDVGTTYGCYFPFWFGYNIHPQHTFGCMF